MSIQRMIPFSSENVHSVQQINYEGEPAIVLSCPELNSNTHILVKVEINNWNSYMFPVYVTKACRGDRLKVVQWR